MSPIGRWLYALSCVLAPVAWGLVVVWISDRLEGVLFKHPASGGDPSPNSPSPLDFHI